MVFVHTTYLADNGMVVPHFYPPLLIIEVVDLDPPAALATGESKSPWLVMFGRGSCACTCAA